MRAFLAYGVASAALLAVLALGVAAVVDSADGTGVRLAAIVAWPVQLAAFGALVRGREGPSFMAAWTGGIALRFTAVVVAALWVTRANGPDPASLLVSLVGFVIVLTLLEPLFLRLKS